MQDLTNEETACSFTRKYMYQSSFVHEIDSAIVCVHI